MIKVKVWNKGNIKRVYIKSGDEDLGYIQSKEIERKGDNSYYDTHRRIKGDTSDWVETTTVSEKNLNKIRRIIKKADLSIYKKNEAPSLYLDYGNILQVITLEKWEMRGWSKFDKARQLKTVVAFENAQK